MSEALQAIEVVKVYGAGSTAITAVDRVSFEVHPGAEVTTGRAAIRTLLTSTSAATLRLHSIAAGVSADGTLGYSFGWLEETRDGRAAWGKFIVAWIFDGGWKVAAFSRSASVQAPSPPPPTSAEP